MSPCATAEAWIEAHRSFLSEGCAQIFDFAEPAWREYQSAAWYADPAAPPGSLADMRQLQGKPLSFNNINDTDAAWQCVLQFENPTCVIVKHANPCGVSSAESNLAAYEGVYPTPDDSLNFVSTFNVDQADFAFRMSDVTKPPAKGRSKAERLLNISPDETPRLARMATRALMVPMAALLALAAIIAGGAGLGRFVAMPVAALILMTGDVLARSVVAGAVETVSPPLLFLLAMCIYLGPPLAYLLHRGEALMIPAGRRA